MNETLTTQDKQFTFLDGDRRQVIFTPKKYDPKTGQLVGINSTNTANRSPWRSRTSSCRTNQWSLTGIDGTGHPLG